MTISVG